MLFTVTDTYRQTHFDAYNERMIKKAINQSKPIKLIDQIDWVAVAQSFVFEFSLCNMLFHC